MSDTGTGTPLPDWLPPSVALSRFQMSAADTASGKGADPDNVRYAARIGAVGVLLPEETGSEVFDRPEVYPVPNTARWLEGMINLRGNLVPVFDLRELFDTERIADARQMVLIVDKGDNAFGLAIDGLPVAAADGTPMSQVPPLPAVIKDFTHAAYVDGDDVWIEVDIPGVLSSLSRRIAA